MEWCWPINWWWWVDWLQTLSLTLTLVDTCDHSTPGHWPWDPGPPFPHHSSDHVSGVSSSLSTGASWWLCKLIHGKYMVSTCILTDNLYCDDRCCPCHQPSHNIKLFPRSTRDSNNEHLQQVSTSLQKLKKVYLYKNFSDNGSTFKIVTCLERMEWNQIQNWWV